MKLIDSSDREPLSAGELALHEDTFGILGMFILIVRQFIANLKGQSGKNTMYESIPNLL
jgi:hypothetical protein